MNDLSGLDWTTPASHPKVRTSLKPDLGTSRPNVANPSATPGVLTPRTTEPKIARSINDSFASLLRGPEKQSNGLSLQERQNQLQQERAKKAQEMDFHFGIVSPPAGTTASQPGGHLNSLKSALPHRPSASRPLNSTTGLHDTNQILAVFNSSAKHDASSSSRAPSNHVPYAHAITSSSPALERLTPGSIASGDADDDPFGLSQLPCTSVPDTAAVGSPANDDDILGMLGRPAEEVVAAMSKPEQLAGSMALRMSQGQGGDRYISSTDRAAAELVDMGFPAHQAAVALAQTDSGCDAQAAVGILLQKAHDESRQRTTARTQPSQTRKSRDSRAESLFATREAIDESAPSWMSANADPPTSTSHNRTQHGTNDKEVSQYASEFGTSFLKSANSFWRSGQKKVQRAMAEMQQEPDSNQPKWMRDAQLVESRAVTSKARMDSITNEALALETSSGDRFKSQTRPAAPQQLASNHTERSMLSSKNPFERRANGVLSELDASSAQRRPTRPLIQQQSLVASSEVYISPARRRQAQATARPTGDLAVPHLPQKQESPLASPPIQVEHTFANLPNQPVKSIVHPVPTRQIPFVSSAVLSTSASHRQQGTESFKRGDFSNAQISYSSALGSLPSSHPINIVILCNRALTNIKNGDPKAAIADADLALNMIGLSKGDHETINLGADEGEKSMKEFYGKAVMRKAEALENLERWSDAAKSWHDAVESGLGGSISIQGRNRCEKASGGHLSHSDTTIIQKHTTSYSQPKPAPKPSPIQTKYSTSQSAEAVRKLRQANAAADRADDEKFALTDQVDAKLVAWKGSKADNLRALIGSLDKILWPEAGWTRVGMHDLIIPTKVKIIYIKAIAKVHPDKISQTATMEQRMLSAAIFATLNEAWDKFKIENGL